MNPSYQGKRLLVLDRDPVTRSLIREAVAGLGLEVTETDDPERLQETVGASQPDVLLAGVDEAEGGFLQRLQAAFNDLPVIVVTGYSGDEGDRQAMEGAVEVLSKPLDPASVELAVRNAFRALLASSVTDALSEQQEKPVRILVAEDDRGLLLILDRMLGALGHEIACTKNGKEALDAFEENDFDAVVSDLRMPEMNGIELTKEIKKRRPRLPVIIMSAVDDSGASLEALRAGAYCYVAKPVDPNEISLFVQRALRTERLENELRQRNELLQKRTGELRKSLDELCRQPDLLAANRMAVQGRLTADVAHELKNPINSINASFYYVKAKIPQEVLSTNPKVGRHCSIVEQQIQRAREIIENMQNFASPRLTAHAEIDIAALLEKTIPLALPGGENVKVNLEAAADPPSIHASGPQLQQVFTNIISNAAQAMKGEGAITITAERSPQGGVRVVFADTGPGLPSSIIDQVFDPFFTTKAEGEGVGLGLSISHGIIRAHGGTLTAGNAPAGGALFTVTLPADAAEGAAKDE